MHKSRRKAREAALQALYQIEIGKRPLAQVLEEMEQHSGLDADLLDFATELVKGFVHERQTLDARIRPFVREYEFERLAAVDRNVLRIAGYELFFVPNIPPAVSINEAIEIVKKYSTAESGRFVNGVLGNLLLESPKANWDPSQYVQEEQAEREEEAEPAVEEIEESSPEAQELQRVGAWKIKSGGGPA
jgi:transcription antitermination protein NusB